MICIPCQARKEQQRCTPRCSPEQRAEQRSGATSECSGDTENRPALKFFANLSKAITCWIEHNHFQGYLSRPSGDEKRTFSWHPFYKNFYFVQQERLNFKGTWSSLEVMQQLKNPALDLRPPDCKLLSKCTGNYLQNTGYKVDRKFFHPDFVQVQSRRRHFPLIKLEEYVKCLQWQRNHSGIW